MENPIEEILASYENNITNLGFSGGLNRAEALLAIEQVYLGCKPEELIDDSTPRTYCYTRGFRDGANKYESNIKAVGK